MPEFGVLGGQDHQCQSTSGGGGKEMHLDRIGKLSGWTGPFLKWIALAGLFLILMSGQAFADITITSHWGTATIDGRLDEGEWDTAWRRDFDHGFYKVQNDHIRLYILIDVLGDDSYDPPGIDGDYINITFDKSPWGEITDRDVNYL
jgi:hypothetical protein